MLEYAQHVGHIVKELCRPFQRFLTSGLCYEGVDSPGVVEHCAQRVCGVQVVVHGVAELFLVFLQGCAESGVLLRSGAFLGFGKAFPGGADTGEGGVGLLDKLTGEIDGVPVLGGEQEQADGLKVEFLSYVPHQAEVAKGLGHLLIIYIYIAVMHPVPCEGLACGRLALGYLVFMVGEYEILPARVNVEGGA